MRFLRNFFDDFDERTMTFLWSFGVMLMAIIYKQLNESKKFLVYEFFTKFFWGISVVFGFMPMLAKDLNLNVEGVVALTWVVTFFPNHFITVFYNKFFPEKECDEKDLEKSEKKNN